MYTVPALMRVGTYGLVQQHITHIWMPVVHSHLTVVILAIVHTALAKAVLEMRLLHISLESAYLAVRPETDVFIGQMFGTVIYVSVY